ncbi:LuxR C-terminal-related transcriptional regulator [Phytohabitans houttuyneae]|uniref:LuxR C-terminal-related transcriptional regulator n=1 Tax=Phytohabitans houttuyneae TaxID=1076126 RepID=UPI001C499339|nr:LuxR C-terminal-related transcriptional regulator [Phytohabitans houttuyneae]
MRDILGADVDRELVEFAAGAGGNRHLLAEFALGLAEEGLVKEDSGRIQLIERRIPRRIVEFVMRQLSDLSTSCQQFLKVAAALGKSFMLEDVSRMLDRSSATLLTPLDEAMAAGFIVAAAHRLAFRSEFHLQGINESIPLPVRDALRREALGLSGRRARAYDQKPWVTERSAEHESVVQNEAGGMCSRAHRLIMNGNAAAGVRVAERVLASSEASISARLDAEASLILGYFLLGRDDADKLADKILRERGTGSGDIAALMALTTRSNLLWRAGELAEGLRLGEAAVHYSESVDPVWRLHFQLALAGKLANLREFDRAESLINDAEGALQVLSMPVWTAAAAAMRSRVYLQSGRIGDARREAMLATTAVDPDAVPMLRPLAYSVLSNASFYMGDLPAAVEYLRRAQGDVASQVVLDSVQYAWTELLIAVKRDGLPAAAELLSGKHRRLPAQRSLYIEVPSAAAFLVVLARDLGDSHLERTVLATVDQLASDNPGVSVIGLTAMHAHALANRAPAALALIIVQSPDPISVALATEELAKLYAARDSVEGRQNATPYSEEVGSPLAACWSTLSDMERRIAYLVSVGLTNRQIAKQVHLSQHTVNYHLRKVYKKLGISTRVELVRGAATYTSTAAVYSMGDDNRYGSGYIEGAAS